MPILSGEWGYSTCNRGVALEKQAAFAARQQLANLLSGVPLSIWYDWKNDGNDPNENEHNFGTVLPDLQPKPAYRAVQTLTRQLAGYRILRRLTLPDGEDYVLLCAGPAGADKLAAWTLGQPHRIALPLTAAGSNPPTAVSSRARASPRKWIPPNSSSTWAPPRSTWRCQARRLRNRRRRNDPGHGDRPGKQRQAGDNNLTISQSHGQAGFRHRDFRPAAGSLRRGAAVLR